MEEAIHSEIHRENSGSHSAQEQQQVEDVVTINIKKMIQDCGDGHLLPHCCIYRVPTTLRHFKEDAYTPRFVSIGPFHYGNERLQDMEMHKQILFKRFTERAMSSLDDLVRHVKHLEPKVRASYSETINLTEQELVQLTLMDAGFIIELFIMFHQVHGVSEDAKLSKPWLESYLRVDLILLENQLPFFVIEDLFDKAFPYDHRGSLPSFLRLTYRAFEKFNLQKLEPNPAMKIKHFTDLLRLFHLQAGKITQRLPMSEIVPNHILPYTAISLQEAGIKLKASKNKCFLDLKISGNTLEIPQIIVESATEIFFRNMMALELCHYPYATYIVDYALVLNFLIDTYKDVDLLVDKKIVSNYLGDANDVALLFNGIFEGVIVRTFDYEYFEIWKRLKGYCEDPWHKMKATLRHDYCNTPWRIVASIAGIILLVLTIVQTIFSVLQIVLKK